MSQINGKVCVTGGSRAVTGTGTAFKADLMPGHDWVRFGGNSPAYPVAAVDSDCALTLVRPYGGETSVGVSVARA